MEVAATTINEVVENKVTLKGVLNMVNEEEAIVVVVVVETTVEVTRVDSRINLFSCLMQDLVKLVDLCQTILNWLSTTKGLFTFIL